MGVANEIFPVGVVVKSTAGRDRKRVFIVVGTEEIRGERRLLLVNGELHKISLPKSKNLRHVKPVGSLSEDEAKRLQLADDLEIKKMLSRFDRAFPKE